MGSELPLPCVGGGAALPDGGGFDTVALPPDALDCFDFDFFVPASGNNAISTASIGGAASAATGIATSTVNAASTALVAVASTVGGGDAAGAFVPRLRITR